MTNRSLSGREGLSGSKRIPPKKRAATMSAAEQQEDGCPLPAAVVLRTESMRRRVAMLWSAVTVELAGDVTHNLRRKSSLPQRHRVFRRQDGRPGERRRRGERPGRPGIRMHTAQDPAGVLAAAVA